MHDPLSQLRRQGAVLIIGKESKKMSWCHITCGSCGHSDDLDAFCRTPIWGDLPPNVYQCPCCHRAVEKTIGAPTLSPSGFVMPGPVTLIEVPSRL